jgi:hypothetical protein
MNDALTLPGAGAFTIYHNHQQWRKQNVRTFLLE